MRAKGLFVRAAVCAAVLLAAGAAHVIAADGQAPAQAPAKAESLQTLPVRVEVLLTRLQGEKRISSLPFSLLANAVDYRAPREPVSIRMGIDVPVGTTTETDNRTTPTGGSA